jgi:putative DNA primase/helicase
MSDEERAVQQRPAIVVNDVQLREPGQLALAALTKVNDEAWEKTGLPRIYVRGNEPVRLRVDDEGALAVGEMSAHTVQYELTNAADFWREGAKNVVAVPPPREVCHYVMSASEWSFPSLRGIITVPVFRPDGTILNTRGYDEPTRLIYDPPPGFEVAVPEKPTEADVKAALGVLAELVGDFPFADRASLANTVALALTPVLREVIDGPTPLCAIDKPSPGTGATLLVESLALATSGREPGALGAVEDDNEMRKQITAAMRSGEPWLFLDNVNVELKSAALARALTAGIWEDRILGVSSVLRVPVRNVWAATSNNLELSLEIARRCYWIRLDAKLARPWERPAETFTHPDLKGWVRENRAQVLGALLTLGRNWFAAGQPVPEDAIVLGSFEAWSKTLGGVLAAAGVEGFLANSGALYERATEDSGMWSAFLEVWYKQYGPEPKTAQAIAEALQGREGKATFREVLPDEFSLQDDNLSRRLGRAFGKREGVRYGEHYLARVGERSRAALWSVRTGDTETPGGDREFTL